LILVKEKCRWKFFKKET